MQKQQITKAEMNLLLVGVEHGVRQCEKGNNLQAALASLFDHFEVKKPEPFDEGNIPAALEE